jgi:outer membrane protein assembly factor BamB
MDAFPLLLDMPAGTPPLAVAPVLVGPIQVLLAILPALLLSLGGLLLGLLRPKAVWAGVKLLWRQKLAVAVIACVVTGSVFAVRAISLNGGPTAQSEEVAGEDWPMFRGGPQRRGSGGGEAPTEGGIQWSYTADVKTFYASPAVVGNRVYVTSADKGPLRDRGAVYCLDTDTGGVVWTSAPSGYLATFSSPAIAGKYLVCGEGLHYTKTARVVCMDVSERGKILWTYQTSSHVESTPCIDKDRVYVGAGDDGYYCFRLDPNADGQPQLVWHAPTERCPDAETSPAVHDGLVFAGLGMNGKAVVALHADTGEQAWRVDAPYPVFGPPTVANGLVIVGMGNGNFIESAEEVKRKELDKLRKEGKSAAEIAAAEKTLGAAGEVWALNEKTGAVQWKFILGDTVLGAIAAANDRLYFGARDGYVYCVSLAGKLLFKWNAHAPIVTSPAIHAGHVYVVTETGKLYGLRADDLELVWEATVGFAGPFLSSPAVGRGHVYVGSQQDGLLCLGVPGGRKQEPYWAGCLGGPGCGGGIDGQPLPDKGKYGWRFPQTEDTDEAPNIQVAAPPACLNGSLYVPASGAREGLLCLREDANKKAQAAEVWFAAAPNGVRLSPTATSQAVYFVDGQRGDNGRHLRCVSPNDGAVQWKLPVDTAASGEFVLTEDGGLIADGPRQLTFFRGNGEVLWRAECGAVYGAPAWTEALVVVATDSPPALQVLDRPSGQVLWRMDLDKAPTAPPLVRKNAIYLGTAAGVEALSLADGELLWKAVGTPPSTRLVLAKDRLAYVGKEELVILGLEDGRVEKQVPGARAGIAPLAPPEAFVFAGKKGLTWYPLGGGEPRSWMNSDWLGRLTCSPVMADSRIYIATDKKGLVCLKGKDQR